MATSTTIVNVVWPKQVDALFMTGCIKTPKLGARFCKDHCVDHQEMHKCADGLNMQDASKEFGMKLGPVLRSAKKKGDDKLWGQVKEVVDKKSL